MPWHRGIPLKYATGIFQSGAKWQKTNVFPIENTLSIILIHNRMVMSGDVFFLGLKEGCHLFDTMVFTFF